MPCNPQWILAIGWPITLGWTPTIPSNRWLAHLGTHPDSSVWASTRFLIRTPTIISWYSNHHADSLPPNPAFANYVCTLDPLLPHARLPWCLALVSKYPPTCIVAILNSTSTSHHHTWEPCLYIPPESHPKGWTPSSFITCSLSEG